MASIMKSKTGRETGPSDWCYVNSFDHPDKPIALRLPAGLGSQLQRAMRQLVRELAPATNDAFEGHSVSSQIEAIRDEQKQREEKAMRELSQSAADQGAVLLRTPGGFAFSPAKVAVGHLMEHLKTGFRDQPKVLQFLDGILKEAIEHGNELLKTEQGKDDPGWSDFTQRCHVNLLVDQRHQLAEWTEVHQAYGEATKGRHKRKEA